MIGYRVVYVACAFVALMLTGCPSNNQVLLPPPGSVSLSGHAYVSDFRVPGVIRILKLPLTSGSTVMGTLAGNDSEPAGMAIDPANNDLIIAEFSSHIQGYVTPVANGDLPDFTISTPNQSEDVAFDGSGNMYVVGCCSNVIDVFDAPINSLSTRAFTIALGADSRGVAFDGSGNLYANTGSGIKKFMPPFNGASTPSATVGAGGNIHGIAFDAHDGLLYQAASSTTIDAYALPLSNVSTKSFTITVPAGLDYIAFDSAGDLYVPGENSILYVYTPPLNGASTPAVMVTLSNLDIPGVAIGP